jgi:hypothetical protein
MVRWDVADGEATCGVSAAYGRGWGCRRDEGGAGRDRGSGAVGVNLGDGDMGTGSGGCPRLEAYAPGRETGLEEGRVTWLFLHTFRRRGCWELLSQTVLDTLAAGASAVDSEGGDCDRGC